MNRLFLVATLAACSGGSSEPGVISGVITEDQLWSGSLVLEGFVTIDSGATVTVEPGTTIQVVTASSIEVQGTLDVQGTKDNVVTFASAIGGEYWLGVNVYGQYSMTYGKQSGGGIYTNAPGASVTIADSELVNAIGDFLVIDGGHLDVQHSNLGLEAGDHTHCNLHINSAATVKVGNNTIAGVAFGLMLYGGRDGDFRHNNWIGNDIDIEPQPGGTGNFDDSFFDGGTPAGVPGSSFENLASARLTDTGPR